MLVTVTYSLCSVAYWISAHKLDLLEPYFSMIFHVSSSYINVDQATMLKSTDNILH